MFIYYSLHTIKYYIRVSVNYYYMIFSLKYLPKGYNQNLYFYIKKGDSYSLSPYYYLATSATLDSLITFTFI